MSNADPGQDTQSTNDAIGRQPGQVDPAKDTRENRSSVVLLCGFLALIPCGGWILGCIAWSMGASDLNRIKRGEMPPEARDATRAGMILGIISVVYQLVVVILIMMGVIPLPSSNDTSFLD